MPRILLTGATGFVGANMAHHLVMKEREVHALVRPQSDRWRIRTLGRRIILHVADLTDQRAVFRAVKQIRPDVVYHMAAHGLFLKQEETEQMIHSNVLGTVHLLEALRDTGTTKHIINVGSFAEYESAPIVNEKTILRPFNAYGASKASQSFFAEFYARFYKMPVVIVRPTLLYGPYEAKRRLVPDVILAYTRNLPLHLSFPHLRKDFLFVEDALDALEAAAARDIPAGEVINIGSGKEHTIRDVVTIVGKRVGVVVPLHWGALAARQWDSAKAHIFDITKARTILGWKPRYTLEEGLEKTIAWFRDNENFYE